LLGIFIIPVNFYVVEKLGIRYKKHPPAPQPKGGKT